jgi:hypothetical protein
MVMVMSFDNLGGKQGPWWWRRLGNVISQIVF